MIKPPPNFFKRFKYLVLPIAMIGIASAIAIAAAIMISSTNSFDIKEEQVPVLAVDEITIVRTPGGMLEVSTLLRNEEFKWSTEHTCPLIDCGKLLGKTISELRVPVHYTYRIPLAAEWKLKLRESYYELTVPREVPKIPPAIAIDKLQIKTNTAWFSPNTAANQASLLKNFGPQINARASQKIYLDAQREQARKTITEFALKWMLEQNIEKKKTTYPIKVVFEGEIK